MRGGGGAGGANIGTNGSSSNMIESSENINVMIKGISNRDLLQNDGVLDQQQNTTSMFRI